MFCAPCDFFRDFFPTQICDFFSATFFSYDFFPTFDFTVSSNYPEMVLPVLLFIVLSLQTYVSAVPSTEVNKNNGLNLKWINTLSGEVHVTLQNCFISLLKRTLH